MSNYTRPKQTYLELSRTIGAKAEDIYDAWLDPQGPGSPWSGARRVLLEPAVDGLFYHCVEHEGREWAHYGRFVALERPRRIEHTWVSEATRGLESIVALTLEPESDGTLVTLRHTGVPDDEFGRQHREGWGAALSAIEERFVASRR